MSTAPRDAAVGAFQISLFERLFASIAQEMGVTLQRSSFSPNIKERRDFSCAVFDRAGRLLLERIADVTDIAHGNNARCYHFFFCALAGRLFRFGIQVALCVNMSEKIGQSGRFRNTTLHMAEFQMAVRIHKARRQHPLETDQRRIRIGPRGPHPKNPGYSAAALYPDHGVGERFALSGEDPIGGVVLHAAKLRNGCNAVPLRHE